MGTKSTSGSNLFTHQARLWFVRNPIMMGSMFSLSGNLQVFNPVVRFVSVDVVDHFLTRQLSSKVMFHDNTVLKLVTVLSSWIGNENITPSLRLSSFPEMVFRACRCFLLGCCTSTRALRLICRDLAGMTVKLFATNGAYEWNLFRSHKQHCITNGGSTQWPI